jgi:7-dehydrocholesterol reductase
VFRTSIGPAVLIVICPPMAGLIWFADTKLDGSLTKLGDMIASQGVASTLWQAWKPIVLGSPTAWAIVAVFAAIGLAFMRLLPGARCEGPISPAGEAPVYKANGVASFVLTIALFTICCFGFDLFPATIIYDHFGEILGALNISSLVLCLGLYLKGLNAPSGADHSSSGNPIFDYYWGTELYPRILGWDVKMFTNCRLAMMGWPLIILSFAAKQHEIYGFVSDSMMVAVALQLLYVAKFFWWETGYLRSIDIMHDHAGFYICWGCMVWVPALYTSSTLYLVNHPNHLGAPLAGAILIVGCAAILVNYLADAQRQNVRRANGKIRVWGKDPVLVHARYTTSAGETKTNVLLASGWWGIARHFHYVPEIIGAFCWTAPALFDSALPYLYVSFLVILLLDRAFRDEKRCAAKYGADWEVYCDKVPATIIPWQRFMLSHRSADVFQEIHDGSTGHVDD